MNEKYIGQGGTIWIRASVMTPQKTETTWTTLSNNQPEVGVLEKFPSDNQDHFWAPLELNSPIHIDVVINDFEDDPIMVENDPTVD